MDKQKLLEAAQEALLKNIEAVNNSVNLAEKDFAIRAVSTLTHTIEVLSTSK